MSKIRQELIALSKECETKCKRHRWVSKDRTPSFHLLYSSVETYETGNGLVVLGLNPSGGLDDANPEKHDRPFQGAGYNAYIDDDNSGYGRGQSPFQRTVQSLAMVLSGADPSEAMKTMNNSGLSPEERMGVDATVLLKNAPSGNIIPFYGSLSEMSKKRNLVGDGERIGWQMLCLVQPRPRLIIALSNALTRSPWQAILSKSSLPRKVDNPDYEDWIHSSLKLKYREAEITRGELRGALLIGLGGFARHYKNMDVIKQTFNVLAKRSQIHGLPNYT